MISTRFEANLLKRQQMANFKQLKRIPCMNFDNLLAYVESPNIPTSKSPTSRQTLKSWSRCLEGSAVDDGHIGWWASARTADAFHLLDDLHTIDDATKDNVLPVKPRYATRQTRDVIKT